MHSPAASAEEEEREEGEKVAERGGGDGDVVVEQEVDWDLQRVVHVASGKVGTDAPCARASALVMRPWSPTS